MFGAFSADNDKEAILDIGQVANQEAVKEAVLLMARLRRERVEEMQREQARQGDSECL